MMGKYRGHHQMGGIHFDCSNIAIFGKEVCLFGEGEYAQHEHDQSMLQSSKKTQICSCEPLIMKVIILGSLYYFHDTLLNNCIII